MTTKHFTRLHFQEVTSSNDLAFELVEAGQAFDGFMVVADRQSKGRGRLDRQWESPVGNLYFSLILQSEQFQSVTDYSFLIACVIGDVLDAFGVQTQYKWPNDVMLDGKKLAGILLQLKRINNVDNLVIGVGVNMVSCPDYAACLAGVDISREAFLDRFEEVFEAYEVRYQQFGFEVIRKRWKSQAFKLGDEVVLSNGVKGVFEDVDGVGNVVIVGEDGQRMKAAVAEIL